MIITALDRQECDRVIAQSSPARLACSKDDQPYIVPIHLVAENGHLYGFSTLGRKIQWMRSNPRVCVLFDLIEDRSHWESVVVTGRFEELPDTPEAESQRHHAWSQLQTRANWWEPGYVRTAIGEQDRPLVPIFFRIAVIEKTGHRLSPSEDDAPALHARPAIDVVTARFSRFQSLRRLANFISFGQRKDQA